MSLPWFRMYHRAIDDERLRLLAFEDRWHYVAILCLKCEGMIDDEQDELWFRRLAVKLGVQTRELEEIQRRLMNVGLVDAHWQPLKWSELQYKSDSSNERVKAYRKRQKKQRKGFHLFFVSCTEPTVGTASAGFRSVLLGAVARSSGV